MRIFLTAILFYVFGMGTALAQVRDHYAIDAFLLTRMAEKFHVQPRPLDENFSALFFDHFFKTADEEKLVFTMDDMVRLYPYRNKMVEEIRAQQNNFLKLVTGIYEQRIRRIDSLLLALQQQPFNFTTDEKLTVAEDSAYPANTIAQQQKLVKFLKNAILEYMIEHADMSSTMPSARQKKITDSLEPEARKKTITAFQRGIKRLTQGAKGIPASMGSLYCQSLISTFDPHSSYLPKSEKENFENHLGQKSMRFGFSLEQEGEGITVHDLKPGSAAFKSGQINQGDKIVTVQWDDKEPIDVSEATVEELSAIFDQSNYGKMTLTVKKTDGVTRKVELQKEIMESDDDENRVRSFLLKGSGYTMGYLSLPAFYTDWDNQQNNIKGCANDVAKEIIRLKKENINGLVLDLRYNGGGSMQEAVELAGIFIDAGPVAQIAPSGGKVYTLKDVNRGTIYDGPLLLLVNGASASASELVAGTLQDYHRAVIMGTPTYGKATGQVILPLDTLTKPGASQQGSTAQTFLKLTIEKLYRITGATAQGDGVIPDIQLPDLAEVMMKHESTQPTVLLAPRIEANRFYTPYAADSLSFFVYKGRSIADTSAWYSNMKKNTVLMKDLEQKKDISLQLQQVLQRKAKEEVLEKQFDAMEHGVTNLFTVQNPQTEEQKLKLLPGLRIMNEKWKLSLLTDPWIGTAFQVLSSKK
ncbi:MAG: S41 family peptidase [Bacteroidota bacterium]